MIKTATCILCGSVHSVSDMYGATTRRRGDRLSYLCWDCVDDVRPYSTRNYQRVGKPKANGFTFGHELETVYSNRKARVELFTEKYIPTSDCTVDVEYKSPVFEGLNAFIKMADTIQALINAGDIEVDWTCGLHTHVGHTMINPESMGWICENYHDIFCPLSDAINNTPDEGSALFGRGFMGYAQRISPYESPRTHENIVNIQHSYTIEFRQCYFVNAEQYKNVVRFCKDVTSCVVNNYIANYPELTPAERKHKADVTGRKIVKLFNKYYERALEL